MDLHDRSVRDIAVVARRAGASLNPPVSRLQAGMRCAAQAAETPKDGCTTPSNTVALREFVGIGPLVSVG